MKLENHYRIGESTSIFFNGEAEIVFRKGVWNYEEAVMDISGFGEETQDKLLDVFRDISDGGQVSTDDMFSKYAIDGGDIDSVLSVLEELTEQGYLADDSEDKVKKLITNLIGGTASTGLSGNIADFSSTLLICDSKPVTEQLSGMSAGISMSMEVMSYEDMKKLTECDLTSKLDALDNEENYRRVSGMFSRFSSVLVCLERPHIRMLRNINRVLLRMGVPFVVCLIDGPFMSVMTIKGYETGCFECYETRVMARLESMSAYRSYVDNTSGRLRKSDNTALAPILGMMASMGLFEAFLINTIHKAKLAGRVFNIYLPLLEVQVQDLLRVPFCSACGQIAKASYEEMYTSSEKIVEKLVESIEISADGE